MFHRFLCMTTPRKLLIQMRGIIAKYMYFIKSGKPLRWVHRIQLWHYRNMFHLLRMRLVSLQMNEVEFLQYIQVMSEFQSAQSCIDIVTFNETDSDFYERLV